MKDILLQNNKVSIYKDGHVDFTGLSSGGGGSGSTEQGSTTNFPDITVREQRKQNQPGYTLKGGFSQQQPWIPEDSLLDVVTFIGDSLLTSRQQYAGSSSRTM